MASHTVVVGIAHPHPAGVGSLNAANRAGEVDAVQPLGFAGPGERVVGARDGRVLAGELQVGLGQVQVFGIAGIGGAGRAACAAVAHRDADPRRRSIDLALPVVPVDAPVVAVAQRVRGRQVDLVGALQSGGHLRAPRRGQDAGAGLRYRHRAPRPVEAVDLGRRQRGGKDLDFVQQTRELGTGGLLRLAQQHVCVTRVAGRCLDPAGRQLAVDIELMAVRADRLRDHVPLVVVVGRISRADGLAAAVDHVRAHVAAEEVDLAVDVVCGAIARRHAKQTAVGATGLERGHGGIGCRVDGQVVAAQGLVGGAGKLNRLAEAARHAGRRAGGRCTDRGDVLAGVVAETPRSGRVIQVEQQQGIGVDVGHNFRREGDLASGDAGLDCVRLGDNAADVQRARDQEAGRQVAGRYLVQADGGRCGVQAQRAAGIAGVGCLVAGVVDRAHLHLIQPGRIALAQIGECVVDGPGDHVGAGRREGRILPARAVRRQRHLHGLHTADSRAAAGIGGRAAQCNAPAIVVVLAGGDVAGRDIGRHRRRLAVHVKRKGADSRLHVADRVGGLCANCVWPFAGRHRPLQRPGVSSIAARRYADGSRHLPGVVVDLHLDFADV